MGDSQTAIERLGSFKASFNEYSVNALFQKYEDIGFIYPEKMAIIKPFLQEIKHNWRTLKSSKEELMWILCIDPPENNDFASVSVIKQSNFGLLAQHLVSNGNPFMSLRIMLYAQHRAEYICDENDVTSSQNWFRPNNRYAYKIFASISKKLGPNVSSIRHYEYLHQPLKKIANYTNASYLTEEIDTRDAELEEFVEAQYGNVFVRAEEIDKEDITLENMDTLYKQYDMRRYRRILKIKNISTKKVIACAIANRSPIGLNFSFIENRCYYIIDQNLPERTHLEVLSLLNSQLKETYIDFDLQCIPIVTDTKTSAYLQMMAANYIRVYVQSIWLREGFSAWYDHIASFLERIEAKEKRTERMSEKSQRSQA